MKTAALTLVRKHFDHSPVPRHIRRHNMRAWVRSIRFLGSKWKGLPMDSDALRAKAAQ